jgi:monoamine oxidase
VDSDVIIAGAGLAGLVAARALVRAGRSVTVVEARDRVGGRTLSAELDGQTIDLGGQWIGDAHHELRALADELGVQTFPQHHRGKKRLDRDGTVQSFAGFLPRLPLLALGELGLRLHTLERLARQVPLDSPLSAARAAEWDRLTLAGWLDRNVKRAPAREMIELATQMIFAVEPRELSFLYFLLYVRSGEGLRRLAEIEGGAQQRRFATGAQSLCTRLAAELGARVRLEHAVLAVEQDAGSVTVRTSRGTLRATRAILAMPPALLAKVEFSPALPPARQQLHTRMPAGSVIKCIAAYRRPFWREAGFSGEAFSPRGLVRATFDDCSPDGSHAALVAFVVGDAARQLATLPDEVRRQQVLDELARLHGPDARTPTAYLDKNWLADEWSAGCYVGTLAPGVLSEVAEALRAPAGRLHFAGTETAVRHMGYLEGALESGERAAAEILAAAASTGPGRVTATT